MTRFLQPQAQSDFREQNERGKTTQHSGTEARSLKKALMQTSNHGGGWGRAVLGWIKCASLRFRRLMMKQLLGCLQHGADIQCNGHQVTVGLTGKASRYRESAGRGKAALSLPAGATIRLALLWFVFSRRGNALSARRMKGLLAKAASEAKYERTLFETDFNDLQTTRKPTDMRPPPSSQRQDP